MITGDFFPDSGVTGWGRNLFTLFFQKAIALSDAFKSVLCIDQIIFTISSGLCSGKRHIKNGELVPNFSRTSLIVKVARDLTFFRPLISENVVNHILTKLFPENARGLFHFHDEENEVTLHEYDLFSRYFMDMSNTQMPARASFSHGDSHQGSGFVAFQRQNHLENASDHYFNAGTFLKIFCFSSRKLAHTREKDDRKEYIAFRIRCVTFFDQFLTYQHFKGHFRAHGW